MIKFINGILLDGFDREQREALWRFIIIAVIVFHWAAVYDNIPGFETGFAKITEMQKISTALYRVQENQLVEAINRERRNVCLYVEDGNNAALAYSVRKRDELLRDYRIITNSDAPIVSCAELGVRLGDA